LLEKMIHWPNPWLPIRDIEQDWDEITDDMWRYGEAVVRVPPRCEHCGYRHRGDYCK
jgi:predicted Zn-ribbon and HTH transcriptional regulator